MSEQTPETDALHEELMRHHLSTGGRNLGQYRTAWKCECGYEFVTDGHRDISLRYAWNEHLAHVAVRVLRPGQPTAQPPNPTTAGEQAASGAGEA